MKVKFAVIDRADLRTYPIAEDPLNLRRDVELQVDEEIDWSNPTMSGYYKAEVEQDNNCYVLGRYENGRLIRMIDKAF